MIIYSKSELPKYGWFQCCFVCKHITSKYMNIFSSNYINNKVYVCIKCQKKINEDKEISKKFKNNVYEFIKKKYKLFTRRTKPMITSNTIT